MNTKQTGPTATANPDLARAAIEARAQRRSSSRLHRSLSRILGRQHHSPRAAFTMLTQEADHVGPNRDPALPTHGETLIQVTGRAAANGSLVRSQRQIDKHAETIERLQARQAELHTRANYRSADRVRHPDGGWRPVADVVADEEKQRTQIDQERANGSRKHQRLPRWLGHVPKLVLVVDFCLLLYFFGGITDVNWASPLSADLVFAALLAVMVTVLAYGFLSFTGHRLRSHKDHSGAIPLADLDGVTRASAIAAIVAIAVLSGLMFTRMRTEVLYALGPHGWTAALLIAVTLAVVSALANFLVMAVHALDGSDEAARLQALSDAARQPLDQAHRMREAADLIPGDIAKVRRRAQRTEVTAVAKAGQHLDATDQAIAAARARHQANGPHAGPPADPNQYKGVVGYHDPAIGPMPDLRPLTMADQHINSDLPETSGPGSAAPGKGGSGTGS